MKYVGRLYGKIQGRAFDLGKTGRNYDDLLDSLQEFVDYYEDMKPLLNDELQAMLNRAEKAIRKAT